MDKNEVFEFISQQKTAFIASVNEQGYPIVRAMLAPRKIENNQIYFSTNTSSKKIKQYLNNDKACVYFYKRGKFKYQGVCIIGEMEVCTDQPTKDMIWDSVLRSVCSQALPFSGTYPDTSRLPPADSELDDSKTNIFLFRLFGCILPAPHGSCCYPPVSDVCSKGNCPSLLYVHGTEKGSS